MMHSLPDNPARLAVLDGKSYAGNRSRLIDGGSHCHRPLAARIGVELVCKATDIKRPHERDNCAVSVALPPASRGLGCHQEANRRARTFLERGRGSASGPITEKFTATVTGLVSTLLVVDSCAISMVARLGDAVARWVGIGLMAHSVRVKVTSGDVFTLRGCTMRF